MHSNETVIKNTMKEIQRLFVCIHNENFVCYERILFAYEENL